MLPKERTCRRIEAPYVSVGTPKDRGSVILAGDEGGPVLVSKLDEEVTEITSEVAKKVGHEFGKDPKTVTDVVLLERKIGMAGEHKSLKVGIAHILE